MGLHAVTKRKNGRATVALAALLSPVAGIAGGPIQLNRIGVIDTASSSVLTKPQGFDLDLLALSYEVQACGTEEFSLTFDEAARSRVFDCEQPLRNYDLKLWSNAREIASSVTDENGQGWLGRKRYTPIGGGWKTMLSRLA